MQRLIRSFGVFFLGLILFGLSSLGTSRQVNAQIPPTPLPYNPAPSNSGDIIRIAITSPSFGSTISGQVIVMGSALHPQFSQYQILYAPDPNPQGVWYPTGILSQTPVNDSVLGTWDTSFLGNGAYQLRLNVNLRDTSVLSTQVNDIHLQNQTIPLPTATTTYVQPVAAFTPSILTGRAPLTVQFNNQSYGNIASYQWNFGDGTGSTDQNTSHIYGTPGIYAATLLVSGPGGQDTQQIFIQVLQPVDPTPTPALMPPVAAFVPSTTYGGAPLTVQFANQSSGNITGYEWNFGDGTTSTDQNPLHTYNAVGLYPVTLTVTGPGGQHTQQVFVQVLQTTLPTSTPLPIPTLTPTVAIAQEQEIIIQVSDSADDVNESKNTFDVTAPTIWVGNAGTNEPTNFTGIRFNPVIIPRGATILSARIEFFNPTSQWIDVGVIIYAEAAGNSAAFDRNNPPSQRQATGQLVEIQSNELSQENTWVAYSNLAPIIQEIVSRDDWQLGNSLSMIIRGQSAGRWGRKFYISFDGNPAQAPRLIVSFRVP